MTDSNYKKARKKVKAKKEFYEHFSIYVVMSIFFIVLNLLTSSGHLWFMWPILGWGLGVFFHYLDVFGIPGVGNLSKEWEEEAIQEELKRLEWEEKVKNRHSPAPKENVKEEDKLELKELERLKQRPKWDDNELV